MRAFLAIDPPAAVREALTALQARLSCGRRMDPDTFHLTLAFLGEITDAQAEAVHDGLSARQLGGAVVHVRGVGTSGDPVPTVLWAGVDADDGLIRLHKTVRAVVSQAGLALPRERFRPHVTLARFRGSEGADPRLVRFCADEAGFALPPFAAPALTFYRSELRPTGARHVALADYPLRSPTS